MLKPDAAVNATHLMRGVKGMGAMILPLYARPPTPGSAIQHVSRRSLTFFPSLVTSNSAWNGTCEERLRLPLNADRVLSLPAR